MWLALLCADMHGRRRGEEAMSHERPHLVHGDDEAVEKVIVVSLLLVMLASIAWQCASFWVTTARVGGRLVRDEDVLEEEEEETDSTKRD